MNTLKQPVLHFWVLSDETHPIHEEGSHILDCIIPEIKLYQGTYTINTFLGEDKGKELYEENTDILPFEVSMVGIDPGHSFGWQDNSCIYRENHFWNSIKE